MRFHNFPVSQGDRKTTMDITLIPRGVVAGSAPPSNPLAYVLLETGVEVKLDEVERLTLFGEETGLVIKAEGVLRKI